MKKLLAALLSLTIGCNAWAQAYGGPERFCSPGNGVTEGFKAIEDFMENKELCSDYAAEASPESQTQLLNALRQDAIEKYNVKVREMRFAPPPDEAEAKIMREQVAGARTLLALQQVDLSVRHSPEEIAAGRASVELNFPPTIMHATGFAARPDPLTETEMERARKAVGVEVAALGKDLQESTERSIQELTALGINPLVQASNAGGDKIESVANAIRANSKIGYQTMIAKHPWILFVKQAEPTRAQLIEAKDAHIAKLRAELEWMQSLKIDHPPDEAALALLFNAPSVSSVMDGKTDAYCPAFNALKARAREAQKFRELTTLAVGIGGGAACIAASIFSAGLAGAGCLSIAAAEFAVATGNAASQYRVSRALYSGVLQGGSMQEYEASQAAAQGYLVMAGLSGAGLAIAAAPKLATVSRLFYKPYYQAGEVLPDAARALPTLSRSSADFPPALAQKIDTATETVEDAKWVVEPVRNIRDIPWQSRSGEMLTKKKVAALMERLDDQPEGVRKAVLGVYNRMQDKKAFTSYMTRLTEDAAAEIRLRGIPKELELLEQGIIPRNAALRVLVKRAKLRGDTGFSTIVSDDGRSAITRGRKPGSNAGFRDAVLQGPFFDKPLGTARHGVDMHFLQRDFVSDVIDDATGGNPRQFWDFIGSKKGINMWVPLFDADPSLETIAAPEFLRHQVAPFFELK